MKRRIWEIEWGEGWSPTNASDTNVSDSGTEQRSTSDHIGRGIRCKFAATVLPGTNVSPWFYERDECDIAAVLDEMWKLVNVGSLKT